MPNPFRNLRDFAQGRINETCFKEGCEPEDDSIEEYEKDEEFIQECMSFVVPAMLQNEFISENADELLEAAYMGVQNYLIGQGMLSEAAAITVKNPKINVVRLNKNAQIRRLTTIITLKMARRDNIKPYQKYKLGQKIKKANMAEMMKRYGAKAERLAKKLWMKTQKSGKVAAVVEDTKKKDSDK